jgi:hypothetical protein
MNACRLIHILELPAFIAALFFFYVIYVPLIVPFKIVFSFFRDVTNSRSGQ